MSDTVTCHHIGCKEEVTQTTNNLCGSHTGEDAYSCGKYFCPKHLTAEVELEDGTRISVCDTCEDYLLDIEDWYTNPVEECLIKLY